MKESDTETLVKAVSAFLILLVAFGILLIFATYRDNILSSQSFSPFAILTVIGLVLLLSLLYLINNSGVHKVAPSKRKKK